MISRQKGKRTVASERMRRSGRRSGARQAGKSEALSQKERRQLIQLVVCGSIFVLLVAVKLLLPGGKLAAFNERLATAMEQNMDVRAVFSAVGRAFNGEERAAQEVYQAVFSPKETTEAQKAAALLPEKRVTALETLQTFRNPTEKEMSAEIVAEEAEKQVSTLAYVLYSNENLPENVSLEQSILGFAYCPPVQDVVVSSDFGYRDHPVEGEERFHYGVDLAADTGTKIACFADGTVTAVGESSSYGKYCVVSHSGGYSTLYAHCSRIIVSSGAEVQEGAIIAEVGETGMATGPHLHFEVQRNGTYLNPIYYITGQ